MVMLENLLGPEKVIDTIGPRGFCISLLWLQLTNDMLRGGLIMILTCSYDDVLTWEGTSVRTLWSKIYSKVIRSWGLKAIASVWKEFPWFAAGIVFSPYYHEYSAYI